MEDTEERVCKGCTGPLDAESNIVRDPLYTGPPGIAPPGLCWECFLDFWLDYLTEVAKEFSGKHGTSEATLEAAWALARGESRTRASEIAGLGRNRLWRILRHWRANPSQIPDFWVHEVQTRKAMEKYEGVPRFSGTEHAFQCHCI